MESVVEDLGGFGKPSIDVAFGERSLVRDIGAVNRMPVTREHGIQPIRAQLLMDQGRVFPERLVDSKHSGKGFVIALDEVDCLVCGCLIAGRNRGDDVADVTRFIAREKLFILDTETEALPRRVVGSEDRHDVRQRARPNHVETTDLCVWNGAAK